MGDPDISREKKSDHSHRLTGLAIIGLFLAIMAGAATVPFLYESTTMWYKLGADKTMMRIGKVCGLLAAIFICAQSLIGLRPKLLVRAFGGPALLRWHRRFAVAIILLVGLHVLLILLPEGLANLPIGYKFWPEMLGAGLLSVIILQIGYSWIRERWRLAYQRWRTIHSFLAWCILLLLPLHPVFVSDSFTQLVPQLGVALVWGGTVAIQGTVRLRRRLEKMRH